METHRVDSLRPASRRRMVVAINLMALYTAAILEKADESVIPAVFVYMSSSFNASLAELNLLSLCRAAVQALASPLSGVLGDSYDRTDIVMIGCLIWGIMTICIGWTTRLYAAMLFAGLNGVGLSLVVPSIASITADSTSADVRGFAFGAMSFISSLGGVMGAWMATNVGSHAFSTHIEGWRAAFIVLGAVSIVVGVCIKIVSRDPRRVSKGKKIDLLSFQEHLYVLWSSLFYLLRIPSFAIIIIQGIVGSMPWQATNNFTAWFQILGFDASSASSLVALFSFGNSIGALFGGALGDFAHSVNQKHGRIIVGQTSILCGIPFTLYLCSYLTTQVPLKSEGISNNMPFFSFALTVFLLGLMASWCGSNNSVIFSQLVPKDMMTRVYGFDRAFEGAVGALGAPLVGFLSKNWYGFHAPLQMAMEDESIRQLAKRALSKSLLISMVVPWSICFVFYSTLHLTFPRDLRRIKSSTLSKTVLV